MNGPMLVVDRAGAPFFRYSVDLGLQSMVSQTT